MAAEQPATVVNVRITEVTFFAGSEDQEDTRTIEVTWRGGETYAVKRRSQVWNGEEWEWEPQPSSRTDDFIKRTRFGYDEACRIAHHLIGDVGLTAVDDGLVRDDQ